MAGPGASMTPSATSRAGRVATARKPPRNVPADSWSRSGIGERDPHDGQAQRGGTREDRPVRARQAGIDHVSPSSSATRYSLTMPSREMTARPTGAYVLVSSR
ncbi:MAG TPA: hypothetical protein VF070_17365 [Streptosporangiaceae bacterium]